MFTRVIAKPTQYLVNKTYMMDYLRTDDEDTVKRLIARADSAFVQYTNGNVGAIAEYQIAMNEEEVGPILRLPLRPISDITSIKAYDSSNVERTLGVDEYSYMEGDCQLVLDADVDLRDKNGLVITGLFGRDVETANDDILLGMEQLVTHLYEHRGDESVELPNAVQVLWQSYIIYRL